MPRGVCRPPMQAGDIYATTNGVCKVLELKRPRHAVIRFTATGYTCTVYRHAILQGNVRDPLRTSVCGVGYLGVGPHSARVGKKTWFVYNAWANMLLRCYGEQSIRYKTYAGVTVCAEWHNFQTFASWFVAQPNYDNANFSIDKDLLQVNVKRKVYSPETCVLVPADVNSALTSEQKRSSTLPVGVHAGHNGTFVVQTDTVDGRYYRGGFIDVESAHAHYRQVKTANVRKLATIYKHVLPVRAYKAMRTFVQPLGDL